MRVPASRVGGNSLPGGHRSTRIIWTHVWHWRKYLGERKGQRCRVWARGRNGSIGVEFEDGYRVVAPRYSVRRNAQVEQHSAHR